MDSTAPPVMVKASVLSDKLRNVVGEGVDSALLLTTSGAILSTASSRVDFARSQECKMLAALVANIWRTYAHSSHGAPCEPNGSLHHHHLHLQQQQSHLLQHGGGHNIQHSNFHNQQGGWNSGTFHQHPGGNQYHTHNNSNNNAYGNINQFGGGGQQLQHQLQQQQQQQSNSSVAANAVQQQQGIGGSSATDLELVLAELDTSKLCCFGLGGKAVLALFATSSTELGLLKLKAASLQAELYDGLRLALRNDFGNITISGANSPSRSDI